MSVALTLTLPVWNHRRVRTECDGACGGGVVREGTQSHHVGNRRARHRVAAALPALVGGPWRVEARAEALVGAWACASCLAVVGMALHHKICHVLGGSSACRMRRRTRWCCHTPWPTTRGPCYRSWRGFARLRFDDGCQRIVDIRAVAWRTDNVVATGDEGRGSQSCSGVRVAESVWNAQPLIATDVRALLDDAFYGRPAGASLR